MTFLGRESVDGYSTASPKATEFGKITAIAVQGHSRSPILVPIENPYTTFY